MLKIPDAALKVTYQLYMVVLDTVDRPQSLSQTSLQLYLYADAASPTYRHVLTPRYYADSAILSGECQSWQHYDASVENAISMFQCNADFATSGLERPLYHWHPKMTNGWSFTVWCTSSTLHWTKSWSKCRLELIWALTRASHLVNWRNIWRQLLVIYQTYPSINRIAMIVGLELHICAVLDMYWIFSST